jgi:carbon-monoxide dehydrogenase medium subunit
MYDIEFEEPSTVEQAVQAIRRTSGRPLAGGQTLVAAMKTRLAQPGTLVGLGGISALRGIRRASGSITIGAMTRHAEVAASLEVWQSIPALARLAGGIGDRQVRNMGTLGGSVANSDPAACYPSAVLALGATVHTSERSIPAESFFVGMYTTALRDGELVTAVEFPVPLRAGYVKLEQLASRFALVGVCVAQTVSGVRVAVTGAASVVYRAADIEQALQASFTPDSARRVVVSTKDLSSDLHASADYRAHLVSVIAARAVEQATTN